MDSPTRLYLLRHGEVEARYHRVFGGRIDMELSPLGQEQAAHLANYLERVPFDAIYASPMKRVQQTLRQFAERQNKSPRVLPELREVDFGTWTGLSWDDVRARFGVSAFEWLKLLEEGAIHEAEPIDQFRDRIGQAVNHILRESRERTVAVVCHGGVIRMALSLLLELPLQKMASFEVEYAGFTIVDWVPGKVEVQLLNFTPWRDAP